MSGRGRRIVRGLLGVTALLLAGALGWVAAQSGGAQRELLSGYGYDSAGMAAKGTATMERSSLTAPETGVVGAPTQDSSIGGGTAAVPSDQTYIIRNAGISVRVDDVDAAIERVRSIAAANKALVQDLMVSGGEEDVRPLAQGASMPSPSNANLVLRIPVDRLSTVERDVAKLGRVLSQSSTESDVTQQHVDLAARLKNLRAEEDRLRSFLQKATKVSEMLEVERELSRVRGEIESMQAQLDYLERQAAMATLSVSLIEPSPVASVGSAGWGLDDALHSGVLATAALVRVLVTVAVPLLALGFPLVLLWVLVRWLLRKRRPTGDTRRAAVNEDEPSEDVAG